MIDTDALFTRLRREEFGRLDAAGQAYLDFTGAGLYTASQVERHCARLRHGVYGNPHSENPTSRASTAALERARSRVLAFLDADADEYDVVFTANASGALRLVAESYPFTDRSRLVLTADNHNSVNGIRCHAARAGAITEYVGLEGSLRACDPVPALERARGSAFHLFAYPAQSNFSGVRHPLSWIDAARERGFHVLLDAAAFVPGARLSLRETAPDYVCLSFYKLFGFPTGVGALIARKAALGVLRRPWFAGGTVDWVSTQYSDHALRPNAEAFEDGTPHYLAGDAICDGLDFLESVGMKRIEARNASLTAHLIHGLSRIQHPDGTPAVMLYGPSASDARGGTVAFNVGDRSGSVIPFDVIVDAAARAGISVRGGCFCNPGCAEVALQLDPARARVCRTGDVYSHDRFADCMSGPVGAVRGSVGIPTVGGDIDRLLDVVESCAASRVPRLTTHKTARTLHASS